MSDWISVAERLPDVGQDVIVWSSGATGFCMTASLVLYPGPRAEFVETWEGVTPLVSVTHWMPLPPKPETKNDNQNQ